MRSLKARIYTACVLFALLSPATSAQWLNFPTPGSPRTPDGKPDLTAPTPRTAEGRPDLSGVWKHEPTTVEEWKRLGGPAIEQQLKLDVPGMELDSVHKYAFNILADFKPQEAPVRPETVERMRRSSPLASPVGSCMPGPLAGGAPPFPLMGLLSEPIKIVQAPRLTMVLYEAGNMYRQLYTDGRQLPKEFDLPAFNGYSAGRWEGDTLVVETGGFNDKTIFDLLGHPHSEALHVTERFRRRDFGHLDYELTVDDPKTYARPFTVKIPHLLLADSDIFEMYNENEKDCVHIKNASGKD
jgi:hypothetical protein